MPEYLAPGVYVEETSFRPKTIEGVSTSTAGFVGPARYGPVSGEPDLITSLIEFERLYGGLDPLAFTGEDEPWPNFLAHGIRAFFEEGGRRLYVARVVGAGAQHAETQPGSAPAAVTLRARFPGAAGNMRVTLTPVLGPSGFRTNPVTGAREVQGLRPQDVVVVSDAGSLPDERAFRAYYRVVREGDADVLRAADGSALDLDAEDPATTMMQVLTVDVTVEKPILRPLNPERRYDAPDLFGGFSLDPADRRSLSAYFTERPASKRLRMSVPFELAFDDTGGAVSGIAVADELFGEEVFGSPATVSRVFLLEGGTDGAPPGAEDYRGVSGGPGSAPEDKSGLGALESIEDVSIVAAPGYSFGYVTASGERQSAIRAVQQHLIGHAERMRYRIAVLDAPDGASIGEVREYRGQIDSKYAALYYPWVTVINPVDGRELNVPPSGHVAGIYARNDTERGVQKAPANEVVRLAVGFEQLLSMAQQEVLNPEGINAFRFFEGRGYRLWGARTATSDGEWKYVNLRRYFNYLERSIDKGTQVFVFESNGDRLWENVRRTVYDFLLNEWKSGRLMGLKPDEAFFVRCDRTTMTQNDIDNGRLICLVGVAPLRPAEFVIFRIGQKLLETRG
jgi:uncharacterized protein